MINIKKPKLNALIRLLDDPSEKIYKQISEELNSYGTTLIPYLKIKFEESSIELQRDRLAIMLEDLKLKKLHDDLEEWMEKHSDNLFEGCIRIAKYGHPNLVEKKTKDTIIAVVEKVKKLMPFTDEAEAVKVMNQIILEEFGFQGNIKNYSHVDNSFIDRAVDNKTGNPIMLSVIYLLVAKELNISICGVNSPAHFLLAFSKKHKNGQMVSRPKEIDDILFFIDPFNNGRIYNHNYFNNLLQSADFDLKDRMELIASNGDIIRRIINNLIYGLHISGKKDIAQNLMTIVSNL